jgi:O-antigen/teichoic acid export membrane protein
VKQNFLLSSAYQVLNIITPIITTPFLSRVIGAEGNGIFSYTQSIANYFVLFAILGMSSYGVRTIAECGDDRGKRSRVFWNAFAMNCVTGAIVVVAYAAYILAFGGSYAPYYLIWGLWVIGSVLDVSWLFFGMQDFSMPTVRNFITKLASVACILLFVRGADDVWVYIAAIAGAYFANSLLVWPFVGRHVDRVRPSWAQMRTHLKPNLVLFVPVIAVSFYTLLDRIMLGSMTSVTEVGYFDYAEKMSKMPMAVITALGSAVLPRMTEIVASGDMAHGKHLISTTMWFMLVCAFALCFGIIGVAPVFCPVFFGEGFDVCAPLMCVISFVIPTICVTNVIGNQFLLPCHRDYEYTASLLVGAALNVVVNLALIPRLGAMGAAVATVASEVAVLVVQSWRVRKDLDLRSYATRAVPFVLFGLAMAVTVRVIGVWLYPEIPCLAVLGIQFVAGAAMYLALALVWSVRRERDQLFELFPRLREMFQRGESEANQ